MACDPVNIPIPGVTRIPIAGPAPYNTLVCCNFYGSFPTDKNLSRTQSRVFSSFILSKFDQVNPAPVFQHSTSGWVAGTGVANKNEGGGKDAWLCAVDDIPNAGFNELGMFYVDVDTVLMLPDTPFQFRDDPASPGLLMLFSYVLVVEPQPGPPSGRHPVPIPMSEIAGTSAPSIHVRHDPPRHGPPRRGPLAGNVLSQLVSFTRSGGSSEKK